MRKQNQIKLTKQLNNKSVNLTQTHPQVQQISNPSKQQNQKQQTKLPKHTNICPNQTFNRINNPGIGTSI